MHTDGPGIAAIAVQTLEDNNRVGWFGLDKLAGAMSSDSHWTDHDPHPEPDDENRRLDAAERFPTDRAFFLGEEPSPVGSTAGEPVAENPELPAEEPLPYEDEDFYNDHPYAGHYEGAYLPSDESEGGDDAEWDETEALADNQDAPGYQAPIGAARPGSVAASAAASGRRIRFDPTQERGASHFDRAHRHSRRVRYLKVILPVVAVLGVLTFFGFVHFAPTLDGMNVELAGVDFESNRVTMRTPQISGFEGTKQAYKITAREAVQDLSDPNRVLLHDIAAEIGIGDGNIATIEAVRGTYNRKRELLLLNDGVTLETTDGQSAVLETARVSAKHGRITTDRPVELYAKDLFVKANAMLVEDRGKHIVFSNGVKVTYRPPPEAESATKDEPGEAAVAQNDGEAL